MVLAGSVAVWLAVLTVAGVVPRSKRQPNRVWLTGVQKGRRQVLSGQLRTPDGRSRVSVVQEPDHWRASRIHEC
jgi:hypothetical protein